MKGFDESGPVSKEKFDELAGYQSPKGVLISKTEKPGGMSHGRLGHGNYLWIDRRISGGPAHGDSGADMGAMMKFQRVIYALAGSKIRWWERVALMFCPLILTCRFDLDGTTLCRIFYKRWRGRIYILKEELKRGRWPVEIMPDDERAKCNFMDCVAGMGLAGSGVCFRGGEWNNPDCPKFKDEEEWLREFRDLNCDHLDIRTP